MKTLPSAVTAHGPADQPRRWTLWHSVFALALLVAAVQILLLAFGQNSLRQGRLIDPDCYMHLQRAFRLLSGQWQASGFDPRLNAPFGYAIHWTALFDGLLAAGAWPLVLIGLDPHAALYLWGAIISPVLLVLSLILLSVGVRSSLPGPSFLWLAGLLFTQPVLSSAFLVGRPDHHSLILGLLLAQMAWLYAWFDGRGASHAKRWAFAAGLAAGVQLCTTVEGLMSIFFVSVVAAIAWLWLERSALKMLALYWTGCLAWTTGWLTLVEPEYLTAARYDRVSGVHLLVLGTGIAGILLAQLLATRLLRPLALGLAVLAACAAILVLCPDFFLGPWPHIDPVLAAWHREIGELQPLIPDSWFHLGLFLGEFAAVLMALPLVVRRLRHGSAREKLTMLVPFCGFVIFGALSIVQIRWSGELQAVMLLPWALTARALMGSSWTVRLGKQVVPVRSALLAGALLLQLAPEALAGTKPTEAATPGLVCDGVTAARLLNDMKLQGSIMTSIYAGPEILWFTQMQVVGAPYELPAAIADTRHFQTADAEEGRALLRRRHIAFVLRCGSPLRAEAGLERMEFSVPNYRLYRVPD